MKRARQVLKLVAAFGLLLLPACTAEEPAMPTYNTEVRPILMAHCVRCHGRNDDTLVGELLPDGGPSPLGPPMQCALQHYEDTADCSPTGVQMRLCRRGAGYCGMSLISTYITLPESNAMHMPPPPANLSAWEFDVLMRWTSMSAPQ